jgi:hypothetical protein
MPQKLMQMLTSHIETLERGGTMTLRSGETYMLEVELADRLKAEGKALEPAEVEAHRRALQLHDEEAIDVKRKEQERINREGLQTPAKPAEPEDAPEEEDEGK